MARVEHEREDLLREATALRERAALRVPSFDEPILCGFRGGVPNQTSPGPDVGFSVYFGQDPAYHFDGSGRLRRAFVADCLYRSQGTTLARLTRVRTNSETILSRHDLSPVECTEFLSRMVSHLQRLVDALANGTATADAQVPVGSDLRPRIQATLQQLLGAPPQLAPRLKR